MHHALSLEETSNFQFIVRAIIPELQNNLTSKCNAHKLLFTFLPIFCVIIEMLPRFEFFSDMPCHLARNNSDYWISQSCCLRRVRWSVSIVKMLKWQAKFWYQNRLNLLKADENIGYKVCSKHKVDNFDHGEGKRSIDAIRPHPQRQSLRTILPNFFDKKLASIRTELSNEVTSSTQSCKAYTCKEPCQAELTEFRVMSEREIVLWTKSVKNPVILILYQLLLSRNVNQLFSPC